LFLVRALQLPLYWQINQSIINLSVAFYAHKLACTRLLNCALFTFSSHPSQKLTAAM
jgi:hypothetical protein